jgi:hypothetical protein
LGRVNLHLLFTLLRIYHGQEAPGIGHVASQIVIQGVAANPRLDVIGAYCSELHWATTLEQKLA